MRCLIAYPGPVPTMPLLQELGGQATKSAGTSASPSPKSNETAEAQT
jgi:hypothetical protein